MTDLTTEMLEGLPKGFPGHVPGQRLVHSVGTAAFGWFRGSDRASRYCIAPHFGPGWTPITVRFSNGNGQPDPDSTQQVRGMAVKFHLGEFRYDAHGRVVGDPDTDLICASIPSFMTMTPEKFVEFEKAYIPRKVRRYNVIDRISALLKLEQLPPQDPHAKMSSTEGAIAFSKKYRPAQAFVVASSMQYIPASYLRTAFHAVHAFDLEGDDGTHRYGRFSFEPADGIRASHLPSPPADYLRRELIRRLGTGISQFNLQLTLADPWDDPNDSTVVWPMNRKRVLMGTLMIHDIYADPEIGERLSFNPGRLVRGIGLSDDPILHARLAAYDAAARGRGVDPNPGPVVTVPTSPMSSTAPMVGMTPADRPGEP